MRFHPDLEKYRIQSGAYTSAPNSRFGLFNIPFKTNARHLILKILADDGESTGWEHVSISIAMLAATPSWEAMCYIKSLFWDDDETVMQFHPKKTEYVNNHNFVLHLWKPKDQEIVLPPRILV